MENQSASRLRQSFNRFRERLSYQDATPQLVVLGVVAGLVAAIFIVIFRLITELMPVLALAGGAGDFEQLSPGWRFLIPFAGALLLGLIFHFVKDQHRNVGVTHVLDALNKRQARLPAWNMCSQFFGGAVALISGQSVGREGPGIHLGGGSASLLGQWLRLPHNSLRILVACGAAAAIAASFNTPMAGVIFAMEVILMEYTIAGFIPVIIASVLGATLSQLVFGSDLSFPDIRVESVLVLELPYMILVGLVFALTAALFIRIYLFCRKFVQLSIILRFLIIGLVTGVLAIYVPQILGIGYDTVNAAAAGELGLELLAVIVAAKLFVSAIATGLGMFGGLIGPSLVIGACLGGALGILGNVMVPSASDPEFYVMLGMVAMMGAVLNAPLAALVAVLELSQSPQVIFPSMLTVVVACLGVQFLFHYRGIFAEHLRLYGYDLYADPGKGFLSRVGVRSIMNHSFRICEPRITREQAENLIASECIWLLVHREQSHELLATAGLARHLEKLLEKGSGRPAGAIAISPQSEAREKTGQGATPVSESSARAAAGLKSEETEETEAHDPGKEWLELSEVPSPIKTVAEIDSLSSLHEASKRIRETGAEALLVLESNPYASYRVVGVLTRETIIDYYGM